MYFLDKSFTYLLTINGLQMMLMLILLLPIVNIITLSNGIQTLKDGYLNNNIFQVFSILYLCVVFYYGIIEPTSKLNDLRIPKNLDETSKEKLSRIVETTNAQRNYLLGAFSLFLLLVSVRLFDFVIFAAKLHEFSNLMSSYNIVDITYEESAVRNISESTCVGNPEDVNWPAIVELSKTELERLKSFLKETSRTRAEIKIPTGELIGANLIELDGIVAKDNISLIESQSSRSLESRTEPTSPLTKVNKD